MGAVEVVDLDRRHVGPGRVAADEDARVRSVDEFLDPLRSEADARDHEAVDEPGAELLPHRPARLDPRQPQHQRLVAAGHCLRDRLHHVGAVGVTLEVTGGDHEPEGTGATRRQ